MSDVLKMLEANEQAAEKNRKIREIVDASGWDKLRRDHPQLWAEIQKDRAESRKYVESIDQ